MRVWLTALLVLLAVRASFGEGDSPRAKAQPEPSSSAQSPPEQPSPESSSPLAAQLAFFEKKIRPVLVAKCYECHSGKSKIVRGGLLLDTREGMRKGGDSGPAVVPGDVDAGLLLEALRYESYEMPPDGRLDPAVIADFETWIRTGAADPREVVGPKRALAPSIEEGRDYWAFQPLVKPAVPSLDTAAAALSPIDRFLEARYRDAGVKPGPQADRATLLRRVTFDLTGLPPEPADLAAFLQDEAPGAFERVIDRLLDSPAFGERWGRHWLDVARFAESSGGGRTKIFPTAWRYRDYVIESYNRDRPFDEFIVQQIAGDLLPANSVEQRRAQLVATAFLALGPTNYELQDKELLDWEVADEQLDTIGRAFLGMTLGCARCHDHKFDPIPTRDYYAMAGILRSTQTLRHANVSNLVERDLPLEPQLQQALDAYRSEAAPLEEQLREAEKRMAALTRQLGEDRRSVAAASLPGIVVDDEQATLTGSWKASSSVAGYVGSGYRHASEPNAQARFDASLAEGEYEVRLAYCAHSNRSTKVAVHIAHAGGTATVHVNHRKPAPLEGLFLPVGRYRFSGDRPASVVLSCETTDGVMIADAVVFVPVAQLEDTGEAESADPAAARRERKRRNKLRAERDELQQQARRLKAQLTELKKAAPAPPGKVMSVAEAETCGDFPVCIRGDAHKPGEVAPRGFLSVITGNQSANIPEGSSGRLELAQWIAGENNPLTARVAVNRIWHHLFGTGLVRSLDNFGTMGEPPTHPQLLDWLAVRFIEQGWSTKQLIREILLSRAYQASSSVEPAMAAIDPDNRLLWRQNRRRLEAEALRDAMLTASGRLDRTRGGPTIPSGTNSEFGFEFRSQRRSVYLPVFRNTLPEEFEVFDFANPNFVSGRRTTSTLPTQALYFMNSPFVIEQARATADRLLAAGTLDDAQRIRLAYRHILGRSPTAREVELAEEYLAEESSRHDSRAEDAWSRLCQALFASLDFRFVN